MQVALTVALCAKYVDPRWYQESATHPLFSPLELKKIIRGYMKKHRTVIVLSR